MFGKYLKQLWQNESALRIKPKLNLDSNFKKMFEHELNVNLDIQQVLLSVLGKGGLATLDWKGVLRSLNNYFNQWLNSVMRQYIILSSYYLLYLVTL